MKNKTKSIIFLTVLITFISYSEIRGYLDRSHLKENYSVTSGFIVYFGYSAGSAGAGAEFVYNINGVEYKNTFSRMDFCLNPNKANDSRLMQTKIPIVYELGNPENSKMLLKKEDYKEFKVDYPEEISDFLSTYFECERRWYD